MPKNKITQPIPSEGESKIDLFQGKGVRKVHHDGEWFFSIVDIVAAITESPRPRAYWTDLKAKLRKEGLDETYENIVRLHLLAEDGKQRETDLANIEGVFRLIQSIPSKKAEPFKRWLAKVGFERLEEIENPDLAIKRAVALYRAKGYKDDWIDNRIKNKASREILTKTWYEHGVKDKSHMAILTDAVSVESLGVKVRDHRALKGLVGQGQSLRDHMTPIELTLTTLGEQATTEIVRAKKPRGLEKHLEAAKEGGGIAGQARKRIEAATGKQVISSHNFLTDRQKANNAKKLTEKADPTKSPLAEKLRPVNRLDDEPNGIVAS